MMRSFYFKNGANGSFNFQGTFDADFKIPILKSNYENIN